MFLLPLLSMVSFSSLNTFLMADLMSLCPRFGLFHRQFLFFPPWIWVTCSCFFKWFINFNWILDNRLYEFSPPLQSLLMLFVYWFWDFAWWFAQCLFPHSMKPLPLLLSGGNLAHAQSHLDDGSLAGWSLTVSCPDHSVKSATSIGIILGY